MSVMGRSELSKLIAKYKCIHPVREDLMDGDGYVLTVREDAELNYLEHINLISNEVVFTPPNFVAHLTAKSKYGRMGLSFLNAAKVHSGFIGRLALEIVNLSNERKPIPVVGGDPFMHIEFIARAGEPSPYRGPYQFQYMSGEEVDLYLKILKREFKSLFPSEYLERMVAERISPDQGRNSF